MDGFIIIGNKNAITYKEVFPLIKDNKVRLGYTPVKVFNTTEGEKKFGNITWYTTFPVKKKPLVLSKTYTPEDYPTYDNYPAIEVSRVKDIPYDYEGVMGVPVTILDYDLTDVEIVRFGGNDLNKAVFEEYLKQGHKTHYGKKLLIYRKGDKWVMPYNRILIKKKFEIVGIAAESGSGEGFIRGKETYVDEHHKRSTAMVFGGKRKFTRILIRRKKDD